MCEVEEAVQQLRDELNVGSLKEPREGEKVRRSLSQLESLQQTRDMEMAGKGVPAPTETHTAGRRSRAGRGRGEREFVLPSPRSAPPPSTSKI